MTPQAIKILEILEDGEKHCPIDWGYADGHSKRLTDINRYLAPLGKTLAWDWCDCGRHTTKIKMRWIEDLGQISDSTLINSHGKPKNELHPIFQDILFPYSPNFNSH